LLGALAILCGMLMAGAQALQRAGPALTARSSALVPLSLDDLLKPIALYPDPLLAQILDASSNPQELLDAGNWLLQNQNLPPAERSVAGLKLGFGPATRTLLQFPTVVDMMCSELDWTRQLGEAITAHEERVLEAVQRLRRQAVELGNLRSTLQQRVRISPERGETLISIQPATQFIYVPLYDPGVVYRRSPLKALAPDRAGVPVAIQFISFTAGVRIVDAFDDEYGYNFWGGTVGLYFGGRPAYQTHVYQPAYDSLFRRAYTYRRPASYRYAYIDPNLRIQNSTYFHRFASM
jgi:hypothetical protein